MCLVCARPYRLRVSRRLACILRAAPHSFRIRVRAIGTHTLLAYDSRNTMRPDKFARRLGLIYGDLNPCAIRPGCAQCGKRFYGVVVV